MYGLLSGTKRSDLTIGCVGHIKTFLCDRLIRDKLDPQNVGRSHDVPAHRSRKATVRGECMRITS